jgi:hypothetical protein
MSDQTSLKGWSIVELMGHNVIAGEVTEQTIAGAAFLRVDVPEIDGAAAFTKFYSAAAIYAITPTDEATARQAAARLAVRPVTPWVVPDGRKALPAPTVDEFDSRDSRDNWDEEL